MLFPSIRPIKQFQSTLSVRRATWSWRSCRRLLFISIHALREESDQQPRHRKQQRDISIHALREESDSKSQTARPSSLFQSTLSVRRATNAAIAQD